MGEEACKSPGQPLESLAVPSTAEPNTPLMVNKSSLFVETDDNEEGVEVIEDGRRSAVYSTQLSGVSDLSAPYAAGGEDETPRSQNTEQLAATVEVDRVPNPDGNEADGDKDAADGSLAALRGDDMTSTSLTTAGGEDGDVGRSYVVPVQFGANGAPPPPAAAAAPLPPKGVRRMRNPARSPRPRRMRAVDWCPTDVASGSGSSGVVPSNATTATGRAVRPGDDPTVNSYATFTTMGEGSILEVDTEDEEGSRGSSSSSSSGSSVGSDVAGAADGSQDGLEDFAAPVAGAVGAGLGVVDKLPPYSKKEGGANNSISGTTAHALRPDDQSVVTFATSDYVRTFAGYGEEIVDKVPQPSTPSSGGMESSAATERAVQMADESDSLATWNTTNTVGLTGNVVDHVPEERVPRHHHHRPAQSPEDEEGEEDDIDDDDEIDDDITVETSNAIKDEPSVSTFATQSGACFTDLVSWTTSFAIFSSPSYCTSGRQKSSQRKSAA